MSSDGSCQSIVNKNVVQRLAVGLVPCSTYTGGYCRARQRLPQAMIKGLAQELGHKLEGQTPVRWRWQERRIRIVDGTTVGNHARYGGQSTGIPATERPATRPWLSHLPSGWVTSLETGALLNAAIGRFNGKGGDEQTLPRSIQDSFQADDIISGDA